jgi:glycosyltransferase involved in cell wall biosynthesis
MKDKKKILIINGAQFGYSTGHYFYCKYLSDDFSISYVCFDRGFKKLGLDGVNVCYVPFNGNKLNRIFRFLKTCIKESYKIKPHLLFVAYFNVCFILALFCKFKKSLLDIRTGSLKKNPLQRNFNNYVLLIQSGFFNKTLILSESLRKMLYIPAKRSDIVPLGAEVFFDGNHNFNTLDLLYVGALNDRDVDKTVKGLQLFLQKKEHQNLNIHYTIIGFGSEAEELKITASISDNNMANIVNFVGRKTYEELKPYFSTSTIGVVFVPQTPWYDFQPVTKLFEYLLSGMPVIATNTYENKLIVNDKNGVLINDTPEEFCNGLTGVFLKMNSYNSSEIRKSVASFTWINIVNEKLKPSLQKLFK